MSKIRSTPTPDTSVDLFADNPLPASSPAILEIVESEPVTPHVTPEVGANPFAVVLAENNLPIENAEFLTVSFEPLLQQAKQWAAKVDQLVKPGVEPTVSEQKTIKETRVALKKIRTTADKTREALKADGLRRNGAIQGAFNIIKFLTEPLEEKLLAAEQFAERKEAARKDTLKTTRLAEVAPYATDTTFYNFAEMPEDVYTNLVVTLRTAHEAKVAAQAKADADCLAKERADRDEQDKIRAENERLRKEAADALAAKARADAEAKKERDKIAADSEKKLQAERAKAKADADAAALVAKRAKDAADKIAQDERDARAKADAELAKVKAAEAKRVADETAAKRKAAKAPEKVKVVAFAAAVRALSVPQLTSPEGIALAGIITQQIEKFAKWADSEAEKL